MPESTDPFDPAATRAGRRISAISIAWTFVGSSFAISFGVRSGSAALVAFGLVGFVDLVGSVALVHHFRHALRTDALSDHFEQRAHRIVTVGLLTIGSVTIVVSAVRLAIGHVPETALADILTALEAAANDGDAAACDQLAATFAAQVASSRAAFEALVEELDAAVSPDE